MIIRWINDVLKLLLNDRKYRFLIYYPNFSVDNIFVNEGFNIIYIIN